MPSDRRTRVSTPLLLLLALCALDVPARLAADVYRVTDGENLLVIADVGGRIVLVNPPVRLGAPVSSGDDVRGLASKPGSGELWVSTDDGILATVAPSTGKLTRKATIRNHRLVDLAFAPSGQLYAVSSCRDSVDPSTLFAVSPAGGLTKVVALAPPDVCQDSATGALAFSADGRLFFAGVDGDEHPYVDQVNLSTLAITRVFAGEDSYFYPTAMAFTSSGRLRISDYGYFNDVDLDAGEVVDSGSGEVPGLLGPEYLDAQAMARTAVPCTGSATALCFYERFRVEVGYGAAATPAIASLRGATEGTFSFGATGLADVTVRLTNTCVTKGKYGFYASGPTTLKLAIKVTDTKTSATKTYAVAGGSPFAPVLQPAAFACP